MTRTPLLALISVLSLCSTTHEALGARGVLQADGILNVKGGQVSNARITVMPADAPSYALLHDLSHFVLELELDNTYLVTFEQAGCVTKQLYFDTTVPVEYHATGFTFPFKVTLERHAHAFTYAGPVGFVHYKQNLTDFGYETDYTVIVDGAFAERMAVLARTGSDPIGPRLAPSASVVVTTGYQRPGGPEPIPSIMIHQDRTAPVVSEVPHLIHRTGPVPVELPEAIPVAPALPVAQASTMVTPLAEPARVEPRSTEAHNAAVAKVERKREDRVMVANLTPAPVVKRVSAPLIMVTKAPSREEELIIEARRVTTIIRIQLVQGPANEYRKVAHAYGGTFFFKDGRSVPEHMYATGTAL